MKKLLVSTSILAALGLAGCGGDTIEDLQAETEVQTPSSRIVFDPGNGNLNIPNDLLMLPSGDSVFDYTLNIPVANPNDFSDPQNALNTQDGWSTNYPFVLEVDVPPGASIDASTLADGIHIFEATLGLDINDPECLAIGIPSAGCKVGDKLVFGQDYALTLLDRDTISVVPLRPLKGGQGHMLVMTKDLLDSSGKSVQGSTTWDLVKQDIDQFPLSSDSQLQLQGLVNTYVDALDGLFTRDELTYVQVFTTLSTEPVLSTIKQLHISPFATLLQTDPQNAAAALPRITVTSISESNNALEGLGALTQDLIDSTIAGAVATTPELAPLEPLLPVINFSSLTTCNGLLAASAGMFTTSTGQDLGSAGINGAVDALTQGVSEGVLGQFGALCAATLYEGNINLPYFSAIPTEENPTAPLTEFWRAACDSGIVLNALPDNLENVSLGPNAETCQRVGLNDIRVNGEMVDKNRFITKFSPIPQVQGGIQSLDVQMTIPNPTLIGQLGLPAPAMPEAGWPVVILVHGITSKKEDMLAITGALSIAGFATVAIDQPVHNSRGFELEDGTLIDANGNSATDFLNLASLPTARDNSRQAVSDLLGVRLGLNAVVDATGTDTVMVNGTDVSLMGVSLGAITGGMATAIANDPLPEPLTALSSFYAIQAASLESPGGGQATFLLESPSFGPLIKGNLLAAASPEFQQVLIDTFGTLDVNEQQLVAAVNGFLGALSDEQLAAVNSVFTQFAFAAQTMTDSSDPINYFEKLADNSNVHMITVVGDGSAENLPDQVIPPTTALPTSGQLPLARFMGLETVVASKAQVSPFDALVLFNQGVHGGSLNPIPNPASTAEMQMQVAAYLASKGTLLPITNESVISTTGN